MIHRPVILSMTYRVINIERTVHVRSYRDQSSTNLRNMHVELFLLLGITALGALRAEELKFELRNGAKIPAIGLGTWQAKDEKELVAAIDVALEAGYRHIDTAFVYQNEKFIGKALKKWFDSGRLNRSDLFVTSKLPASGMSADKVDKYVNRTLADLQLDHLDMYLVHVPFGVREHPDGFDVLLDADGRRVLDPETDHRSVWKAMERLVDDGRAKAIGVSNFNETQVRRLLEDARIPPSNLQVEHHLYLQQSRLIDFCKANRIVVTAYSPLGSPGLKKLGIKVPGVLSDPTVLRIAEAHNKTAAQVLIRHIVQRGIVAIPKSVHAERIRQNRDVFDFELSHEELEELNALDKGRRVLDFEDFYKGVKSHPEYPFRGEVEG